MKKENGTTEARRAQRIMMRRWREEEKRRLRDKATLKKIEMNKSTMMMKATIRKNELLKVTLCNSVASVPPCLLLKIFSVNLRGLSASVLLLFRGLRASVLKYITI